jgi:transcriptional regulator with XRE-family HTH domain
MNHGEEGAIMVDYAFDPWFSRDQIARFLRASRDAAGLTQEEVVTQTYWSVSKLNRIETGHITISVTDLRTLLALYSVHDAKMADVLVRMAVGSRRKSWHDAYQEIYSEQFRTLIGYESAADRIDQLQPFLVPGLLQTEAYARACLRRVAPAPRLELAVEARLARQRALAAHRPAMNILVDESVIRRIVGGPTILREQLESLLKARDDGTTIRVLPFRGGIYDGLADPFLLLHLPDDLGTGVRQVLFLESLRGSALVHEDTGELATYREKWEEASRFALSEAESAELVREQIESLESH